MVAKTPADLHKLFVETFNKADLDSLVSLYEPNATLAPLGSEPVRGHAAIRDVLSGFLAGQSQMKLEVERILIADDVALLFSDWTLRGTGPDGTAVVRSGQTSDVARRQPDGSWLLVIDNPYGSRSSID